MLLTGLFPVGLSEPRAREVGSLDLAVVSGSISINPSHPDIGEQVKVTAEVTNLGDRATVADVMFWDGKPAQGRLIDRTQAALGPGERQPALGQWNTSDLRSGFHELWVAISPTDSNDKDNDWSNNNASRDVTLTTTTSKVVKDKLDSWNGPLVLSDLLGVWGIGWLTLDGANLYFAQEYDYQYGIVVDEKGKLVLRNTTVASNHDIRILVEGDGQLVIEPGCTVSGKITTRDRAQVMVSNSTVSGGTDIVGGNFTVVNSAMSGVFQMERTNMSLTSAAFHTNETILMRSCAVNAFDTVFDLSAAPGTTLDTLDISGASMARLTGVVTGTVNVQNTSMVFIYRYLTMHAEDTSGLAIPFATLWLRNNLLQSEQQQCQTTDKSGDARFTVITDQLLPGPLPKAVGSYNITGIMDTVQAQTNIQLPYYPTMTAESNQVIRTIVFEPIFYQTGHDPYPVDSPTTMGDIGSVGDWSHTGDVYVRSTFTLYNVPLYIEQPDDFWAGVYIYPTGKLNFIGGGITSNKRMNVYIIGAGQLSIEPSQVMNGILNINALIGLEDASHTRGDFSANNLQLNGSIMGAYRNIKMSVKSTMPHAYNVVNGALAFSVENGEIANATVTAPGPSGTASRVTVGQSLKFTQCDLDVPRFSVTGNVVAFTRCNLSGLYTDKAGRTGAGSLLNLSSSTLSVIECELGYEGIQLSAQSFISTSTDYPIPLVFTGSSTGLLTDVNAPAIIVNDSAEVTVQWLFTLTVTDLFGSAVEGAEVTVRNYTSNITIPGGQQTTAANGKAVFLLLGKKVYANEVVFLGNYKVMVVKREEGQPSHQYGPYDISMRSNIDLGVQLSTYNNPLERLIVHIDNLSRYSGLAEGDDVFCRGHVQKVYKGGYIEPAAEFPVTLTLSTSGFVYNATTDKNGYFNISFKAPTPSARNISVIIEAAAAGVETGTDSVLNLSVPVPKPDALRITGIGFDHTDRKYLRVKDRVVITGNVENMLKGQSIGVAANITVSIKVSPGGSLFQCITDGAGRFHVDLRTYSTAQTYTVFVDASSSKDNVTIKAPQVTPTFQVKKAAPAPAPEGIPFWVYLIVIIVIVGVAAGSAGYYLYMKSEAAKLVECGQCGAFIPESALKCPKCGTEFEPEVVKCSECGAWIEPDKSECPKCGAVFKKKEETKEEKKGAAPPKQGPKGEGKAAGGKPAKPEAEEAEEDEGEEEVPEAKPLPPPPPPPPARK